MIPLVHLTALSQDWLADEAAALGHPVRGDLNAMRMLRQAAEAAKIQLSVVKSVAVQVPVGPGEASAAVELTRAQLEGLCEPLLRRLKSPLYEVALSAGGLAAPGVRVGWGVLGISRTKCTTRRLCSRFDCRSPTPRVIPPLDRYRPSSDRYTATVTRLLYDCCTISIGVSLPGEQQDLTMKKKLKRKDRRAKAAQRPKGTQKALPLGKPVSRPRHSRHSRRFHRFRDGFVSVSCRSVVCSVQFVRGRWAAIVAWGHSIGARHAVGHGLPHHVLMRGLRWRLRWTRS